MATVEDRLLNDTHFRRVLEDIEADTRERELSRVKADPKAHQTTRLFDGPMRWLYWEGGTDKDGRKLSFCYSTTRNAAGYFLAWREVYDPKTGTGNRDRFTAWRLRRAARETMERWAAESRDAKAKGEA